ncbi:Piso0_002246 [Millerozyma farinosa CBS 7064]|uniref:Piso0_002246 protein n=1 Tax=Pichia sorbitophila (strain ATCC MYA-4447 / BCRC 22081 / CBS 7064 / NBRC 10061 / NRRL Y-12695) TaxID=559304 RepID=G8YC36_PICSO|nr:Piso0_002246 [Millerozyma farinosa CBS 7064]
MRRARFDKAESHIYIYYKPKYYFSMGNRTSKPARKLGKEITKNLEPSFNRSEKVNPLPSEALRKRFEQQPQQEEGSAQSKSQNHDVGADAAKSSNDPLSQKQNMLKNEVDFVGKNKVESELPEGKDGFDPDVGSYDASFVNSLKYLGKQIHSNTENATLNPEFSALKQLKKRKELYDRGQKELEIQKDPHGPAVRDKKQESYVQRTMVHPRTLSAILSDLKDPRTTDEGITLDYQLNKEFLRELGPRFSVASNHVPLEEDKKEDEISHQVEDPGKSMLDDEDPLEKDERMDSHKLQSIKRRLGLDEDESSNEAKK